MTKSENTAPIYKAYGLMIEGEEPSELMRVHPCYEIREINKNDFPPFESGKSERMRAQYLSFAYEAREKRGQVHERVNEMAES